MLSVRIVNILGDTGAQASSDRYHRTGGTLNIPESFPQVDMMLDFAGTDVGF